jgi:hypothetical protein
MSAGLDRARVRSAYELLLHCGAPSAIMSCGEVASDVAADLASSGFQRVAELSANAIDIDRLSATSIPSGYRFARASSPDEREAWAAIFSRGYELPLPASEPFAAALGAGDAPDDPIQYFWILRGEQPVCTSVLTLVDGLAGIYAVSTVPEERSKGLAAFATTAPLRAVRDLGYRVGVLQATKAGLPVYRRLGFVDLGEIPLFVRSPR